MVSHLSLVISQCSHINPEDVLRGAVKFFTVTKKYLDQAHFAPLHYNFGHLKINTTYVLLFLTFT